MQPPVNPIEFEPSSFRDPYGRVFYRGNGVFRTVSGPGLDSFRKLKASGLLDELVDAGLLTRVQIADSVSIPGVDAVLEHERIPFLSYPYEWSFNMLRDAGLLTLEILERALKKGFTLKDATGFNVFFNSGKPVFVDVFSFEPYVEGTAWHAYGQFCRSFLFPLLVDSYLGMDFQPLLRSSTAELGVQETASMFGFRHWFKPGVFKDVVLQAMLQRSYEKSKTVGAKDLGGLKLPKEALLKNAQRLRGILQGLTNRRASTWSAYECDNTYDSSDRKLKEQFVAAALSTRPASQVVDLGCNSGAYSEVASRHAESVVGIDLDPMAVDRLYERSKTNPKLRPLVSSLTDPTPPFGWALRERKSLPDRLRGDFFLALALVHHLRISGNLPFEHIFSFLGGVAPRGIIEWVDREDPMVRKLLAFKAEVYGDYGWEAFERALKTKFRLVDTLELQGGKRKLCLVEAHAVTN